ncbi:hypothetical protein SO3561_06289 [Streptomyces olivochromogenes]|uniref:Uncharacterized protein n=1 Tax=Streptomyces olivochromogenes TaxID=1963 RepID=A0A250VKX4_STROL|nr:hypothetical protein SO3561_06289 [Streptomyces olivochromogenes]
MSTITPTYTAVLCTFPECSKPVRARALCMGHYAQQSKGKPLTPLRTTKPSTTGCAFPGCRAPHWGHGLCRPHNKEKARGTSSLVPPGAPYRIQQQSKGRWFTIGYGEDSVSAHRTLNRCRASNPATGFRLILSPAV